MKRKAVLITAKPVWARRFLNAAEDRLSRLEVSIPLVIQIYPSMRIGDRLRDLRGKIRRQARINQISQTAQFINHFGYSWFNRSDSKSFVDSYTAQPQDGCKVVTVESANDDDAVQLIRAGNFDFSLTLYADQMWRRTLEAIGIPIFNTHYSDPAFVRGRPPVFWEILDRRDQIQITLHRVTEQLDGGAILLSRDVPIDWRLTLRETMRATCSRADDLVSEQFLAGIEKICDGSAKFRSVQPGPLRTTPTISQILKAEAICRRKYAGRDS